VLNKDKIILKKIVLDDTNDNTPFFLKPTYPLLSSTYPDRTSRLNTPSLKPTSSSNSILIPPSLSPPVISVSENMKKKKNIDEKEEEIVALDVTDKIVLHNFYENFPMQSDFGSKKNENTDKTNISSKVFEKSNKIPLYPEGVENLVKDDESFHSKKKVRTTTISSISHSISPASVDFNPSTKHKIPEEKIDLMTSEKNSEIHETSEISPSKKLDSVNEVNNSRSPSLSRKGKRGFVKNRINRIRKSKEIILSPYVYKERKATSSFPSSFSDFGLLETEKDILFSEVNNNIFSFEKENDLTIINVDNLNSEKSDYIKEGLNDINILNNSNNIENDKKNNDNDYKIPINQNNNNNKMEDNENYKDIDNNSDKKDSNDIPLLSDSFIEYIEENENKKIKKKKKEKKKKKLEDNNSVNNGGENISNNLNDNIANINLLKKKKDKKRKIKTMDEDERKGKENKYSEKLNSNDIYDKNNLNKSFKNKIIEKKSENTNINEDEEYQKYFNFNYGKEKEVFKKSEGFEDN
jgi:hypothetical protein